MMQDWRTGDMNMAGVPDAEKVPATVFTGSLYNGLVASDYFVEDASYVKIRGTFDRLRARWPGLAVCKV